MKDELNANITFGPATIKSEVRIAEVAEREQHDNKLIDQLGLKGQKIKKTVEPKYPKIEQKALEDLFGVTDFNKQHKTRRTKIWNKVHIFAILYVLALCMVAALLQAPIVLSYLLGFPIVYLIGMFVIDEIERKILFPSVQYELVTETEVDIPYGAKLKIAEAMTSSVKFDCIYLVYPSFKPADPVIVGKINNQKYLIYAWNIDKDKQFVLNRKTNVG